MLDFNNEIEICLKSINNTNDKEQNFQGRLYAHFLPFEKDGYIVEMETSVNDEHLKSILKDRMHDNTPSDFTKAEKYDFLGGSYPAKNYGRIQSDESGGMSSFKWVQLVNHTDKRKYKYYIIKFGETNIC